jgi:very-short-patch-repair endonuclease
MVGDLSPSIPLSVHGEGEGEPRCGHRDWSMRRGLWGDLKPLVREQRHEPTQAEALLWQSLRRRQVLGFRFRRQHPIERFVVDFYCSEARLVIEVDGAVHNTTREYDSLRPRLLESMDITVLRFSNEQVLHENEAVLSAIVARLESLRTPSPWTERGQGERS